jgi:hypothetical protein
LRVVSATDASTNDITITSGVAMPLNSWTHVAVVRYGNIYTLYQDGVSVGTPVTSSAARYIAGTIHSIGGQLVSSTWQDFLTGYIDDIRFTKSARYTQNFA